MALSVLQNPDAHFELIRTLSGYGKRPYTKPLDCVKILKGVSAARFPHGFLPQKPMKKMRTLSFCFFICFALVGCSFNTQTDTQSNKGSVVWETFLSSIQGGDIRNPSWSIYRENPTNDEIAQYLRDSAACQTNSSDETFGSHIWTLDMYVNAPSEDEWDYDHILILSAGFQEDLVRISGGDALPEGIFYVEDSELYWMVRCINDYETSIDASALSTYQNIIEAYIAEEKIKYDNPAVKVDLVSLKERINRSDIGVVAYSIGIVLTSDTLEDLMLYMAGGAYFDSLLRLHPDGNSARSTMLVINGTPVGFLSWEALDAIEDKDIRSSEEVMNILSQGKDWFKAI